MPTNFILTLDTTPPDASIVINSGDAYATARAVVAAITSAAADKTQMKVWGDVDPTFDANVQATEAGSAFQTFAASLNIRLSSGDGAKTIHLKLVDDVGNVSTEVTDSIVLDTTAPVPNITVAASPTKISKVATFDTSTLTWRADTAIQAWKIKVVSNASDAHTAGVAIPTTAGSTAMTGGALAAATDQISTIKGTDLESASAGDGAKIVKIFVQDAAGLWSV